MAGGYWDKFFMMYWVPQKRYHKNVEPDNSSQGVDIGVNRRPWRRDKWALSGNASKHGGHDLLQSYAADGIEELQGSLSPTSPLVNIDQGCREAGSYNRKPV